jgi:DNA-binding NtrC family response regulator
MIKTVAKQSQTANSEEADVTLTRVLHVDDDEDFLVISKRLLERQGSFRVEIALSVRQALQKIEQNSYDVVVSDYQMFGRNGLEFLRELRADGNDVPFFLVTGDCRDEIVMEALNLGVYRCFSKNRDFDVLFVELASTINEALNAKRTKNAASES